MPFSREPCSPSQVKAKEKWVHDGPGTPSCWELPCVQCSSLAAQAGWSCLFLLFPGNLINSVMWDLLWERRGFYTNTEYSLLNNLAAFGTRQHADISGSGLDFSLSEWHGKSEPDWLTGCYPSRRWYLGCRNGETLLVILLLGPIAFRWETTPCREHVTCKAGACFDVETWLIEGCWPLH